MILQVPLDSHDLIPWILAVQAALPFAAATKLVMSLVPRLHGRDKRASLPMAGFPGVFCMSTVLYLEYVYIYIYYIDIV